MAKPGRIERAALGDLRDEVWDEIAKARNISVRKVTADAKRVQYRVSIDRKMTSRRADEHDRAICEDGYLDNLAAIESSTRPHLARSVQHMLLRTRSPRSNGFFWIDGSYNAKPLGRSLGPAFRVVRASLRSRSWRPLTTN